MSEFCLCSVGEFGIGSTNNHLTDIILNSHHLSVCTDNECKEIFCLGHSFGVGGLNDWDVGLLSNWGMALLK